MNEIFVLEAMKHLFELASIPLGGMMVISLAWASETVKEEEWKRFVLNYLTWLFAILFATSVFGAVLINKRLEYAQQKELKLE